MRELALDRRFAGLLAWHSFFHLSPDDQRALFRRFQAHAEPGAALIFNSGNAEGNAVGELAGDPLYHGSLDPDEYRALLDAAGFEVVAHAVEDPDLRSSNHLAGSPAPLIGPAALPGWDFNPLVVREPHLALYAAKLPKTNDRLPTGTVCMPNFQRGI